MLRADRILVSAEVSEAMVKKRLQPTICVVMLYGITKVIPAANEWESFCLEFAARLFHIGISGLKRLSGNTDSFRKLLAIVSIKAPLPPERTSVLVQKQPHPSALLLIELRHEGFATACKVFLDHRRGSEKHRRRHDLEVDSRAFRELTQAFLEQIVDRISEVITDISLVQKDSQVILSSGCFVMASMEDGEPLDLQGSGVHRHRGSVQQKALPVHLDRPFRIGSEEKRVLNQCHGTTLLDGRMISK